MDEKKQLELGTRLVVIETLIAFLLARESAISDTPIAGMHEAFVTDIPEKVRTFSGREDMGAYAENLIDSIYAMAHTFREARPK